MRQQLIQYVELLFAGARDCEDIKQEILQNTLDRYDDLIAEGKVPEAAYRLAITGIGDINEILGTKPQASHPHHAPAPAEETHNDTPGKKLLRAIAVGLYILCPIPVIALSEMGMDIVGLCGTLAIVAAATVMIMLGAKKSRKEPLERFEEEEPPKSELGKSISGMVWAIGIALYFLLSFTTNYWHVTWVLFPILGAVDSLLNVLVRKREAAGYDVAVFSDQKLRKSLDGILWAIGLAVYFLVSFATMDWHITWVIFLITGAVQGLVRAILDYKEAVKNET